jgi:exopolysaccharide biosynthesis polyprenyl glycosylphosphotransferase
MIRRKSEGIFFAEKFIDQIIVYGAWLLSYLFRFEKLANGQEGLTEWYLQYGLLLVLISIYFFKNSKLYLNEHINSLPKQIITQIKANATSLLIFVVFAFFLSQHRVSRIMLVTYFIISTLMLIFNKIIFRKFFLTKETKAVVIGDGKAALKYIESVSEIKKFKIVSRDENSIPEDTDLIVIGFDNKDYSKVDVILNRHNEDLIPIVVLPDIQNSVLGYDIQSFRGIPMIVFNEPNFKSFNLFLKRVMDFTSCSIGLLLISPILLTIAALVRLTSKGPIFYGQVRMGVDGREFKMWKFRSMVIGDANTGGWTVKNDPRVTPLGNFMRKTSIDELPQLWNVVVGDMSLVGPRPERPQFVHEFKKDIPAYMLRHKMKAGITGWAQVNGWRGDTSIAKRIECDLWYIKNWSLWLDISIVFMTFWKGFINKNAY